MALAGTWSCQGRTQYCELLTCVVVSLTPQVSTDHIGVADAVDEEEEEDMKWRKGIQRGAGLAQDLLNSLSPAGTQLHLLQQEVQQLHCWHLSAETMSG